MLIRHFTCRLVVMLRHLLAGAAAAAARPRTLARLFGCQASLAVLLLAVLVPPFENSDEFNHTKRAEQIATGHLVATRYAGADTSGGVTDQGIDRVDGIIGSVRFHPERKVTREMLDQAGRLAWGQRAPLTFANTAIYAPVLYLPAALAIRFGKHAGLSIVHTLMVARAASGLGSVWAAAAAIALAGEAALLLVVLCSLPMSLSMFAAVSQDGPMLAAAALALAVLVRRHARPDPSATCLALPCALLAVLVVGRPAYAPLFLLACGLPGLGWPRRLAAAGAILVPVAAWSVLAAHVTMINTELHRGVQASAQLQALLASPGRVCGLMAALPSHQGMEGSPFYQEFIGVLGWLDVTLPGWYYSFAVSVIAAVLMVTASRAQPRWPVVSMMVASVGIFVAVACVFLFGIPHLDTCGRCVGARRARPLLRAAGGVRAAVGAGDR